MPVQKELTAELVKEFIEKIVVLKPVYIDGKRHQSVDIYYNGVGIIPNITPKKLLKRIAKGETLDLDIREEPQEDKEKTA